MISLDPPLNPPEATPKSAGITDEVVETQVAQRASSEGEEAASRNSATSALIIYLVISLIERDILLAGKRAWSGRDFKLLLRNMSLVHRSWTIPSQELLFRRVDASSRRDLVVIPTLFQHPVCSMIREFYFGMRLAKDDVHNFVHLLQQIPSIQKLTLSVWDWIPLYPEHRFELCAKMYAAIAPSLPNLTEFWIKHHEIKLFGDCVKCLLQRGTGGTPFILKQFSISDFWTYEVRGGFIYKWKMLLSPAQLHPAVSHENSQDPFSYSSPQTRSSGDISKCSIAIVTHNEDRLIQFSTQILDAAGLFADIHPQISHFSLFLPPDDRSVVDYNIFNSLLSTFLGRCTSLTHMNLFAYDKRQEMAFIPFSNISKSLQVLNVCHYYPLGAHAQERASGLERAVRAIRDRDRTGRSSLERIEVTFCQFSQMDSLAQSFVSESTEMALPEYLDPARRMCRELDIDLVCRVVKCGCTRACECMRCLSAYATTANVTVDDQYGDEISGALPAYSPVGSWSQGNDCSTCALRPDPADAFNSSWHDTTFSAGGSQRTISVNFTGIAVYAFFIVPDAAQGVVTVDTDLIFTLDGEQAGNYSHSPTGGAEFLYDEPCFAVENLVNGSHQLVMSATAPPNSSTAVLFDYLIYTSSTNSSTVTSPGSSANSSATALLSSTSSTALPSSTSSTGASPSETPTHSSHVSTGAVVGGTIGGIAAAVVLLLLLLRCRKSQSRYIPPADVQSPMSDGSTRASRYDLFSPRKTPSELEVHPAVFDEPKPEDGSPTARQRPYFQSYLHDSEKALRSAQNISTLTATQTTDGRLSSEPASSSTSNNNADIVSQVAALQATVRSLQEQRVNPRHSIISEGGEPPAYSHVP